MHNVAQQEQEGRSKGRWKREEKEGGQESRKVEERTSYTNATAYSILVCSWRLITRQQRKAKGREKSVVRNCLVNSFSIKLKERRAKF